VETHLLIPLQFIRSINEDSGRCDDIQRTTVVVLYVQPLGGVPRCVERRNVTEIGNYRLNYCKFMLKIRVNTCL